MRFPDRLKAMSDQDWEAFKSEMRRVFSYDPETGVFMRLVARGRWRPGRADRPVSNGYRALKVNGYRLLGHRVAWVFMNGERPPKEIDHINGIRSDNRWVNLRAADRFLNMQNLRAANSNNKSGFLGVTSEKSGRFRAAIIANGVTFKLGRFNTPEEAHAVYLAKKREIHGGCVI